jgi:hypothetical protein
MVLKQQGFPLSDDDYRFLAENYVKQSTLANGRQGISGVDYRKFLSDLKLHG